MEQLLLFEDDLEQRGLFVIEEMVHPENLRRAHSRGDEPEHKKLVGGLED